MIELMVVLALLAVLASVAAPSLGSFIASRRVEDTAKRLGSDLVLARNEAVKRNAAVLVCADASVTDSSCNATPAAVDWAKGWRVCFDGDGDGSCDAGATTDPNPIRQQAAVSASLNLTGPLSRIRFNPNGTLTASALTTFNVASATATAPRWLVRFAATGATSVRKE